MGQSETEGEEVDCAAPSLPSPEIRLSRTAQSAALSALDPFLNLFLGLSAQAVVSLRLRRSHGPKRSLSSCHSRLTPAHGAFRYICQVRSSVKKHWEFFFKKRSSSAWRNYGSDGRPELLLECFPKRIRSVKN